MPCVLPRDRVHQEFEHRPESHCLTVKRILTHRLNSKETFHMLEHVLHVLTCFFNNILYLLKYQISLIQLDSNKYNMMKIQKKILYSQRKISFKNNLIILFCFKIESRKRSQMQVLKILVLKVIQLFYYFLKNEKDTFVSV